MLKASPRPLADPLLFSLTVPHPNPLPLPDLELFTVSLDNTKDRDLVSSLSDTNE